MGEAWPSLFRLTVGLYWLYFGSQKWQGVEWMRALIKTTADANPIPGLHQFLEVYVVPNWFLFAVAQGAGETVAALLLIIGLATRWAGVLGLLLAANLALTVAFAVSDDGFRWLYFLGVLVNAQVIVSGAGPYALSRFKWVPAYLR
jgi:uncharacterized membrane protein YphA (DoxX/SURF4 family)